LRPDFAEIEELGRESGILEGTAHFDDYVDTSFAKEAETLQPYVWEATK
jgi:hypothetical protein